MEPRSQDDPPDPSDFFRLNEELARELARLDASGQLDRLLALLEAAGSELWVTAARRADGLEEALGVLRPRRADAAPVAPVRAQSQAAEAAGCCGPPDAERVQAVRAEYQRPRGGWDHEGVLAARSQFRVVYTDGSAREVYMPDHLCPVCFHDGDNRIRSCARECSRCGFTW
jgi:hypothetical protein